MDGETQVRQAVAAAAVQRQQPTVSHVSLATHNPEREALVKLIHSKIMDFQVNHPPTLENAVGIWLKVSMAQLKQHGLSMLRVTEIADHAIQTSLAWPQIFTNVLEHPTEPKFRLVQSRFADHAWLAGPKAAVGSKVRFLCRSELTTNT